MIALTLFVFSCFEYSLESTPPGPLVQIPQGTVQGFHMLSYNNRTFSSFEGIPFAQPPVGQLRFEPPQAAGKWEGILLANVTYTCLAYSSFSLPIGGENQEDCLYINVYVPRVEINQDENLDVIVHIHGGGFMMGSPFFMAGPDYLMDKDVVFVTFNYRLALLGFLSTEDDVVPGNMAMKDQSLALLWINQNIKYFGGNPNSVTITGTSAGAASVHFHYLSPLSKGLFHKGFSQSGTSLASWALSHDNASKVKKLAKHFNCSTSSSKDMIDCLKEIDAIDLINGQTALYVFMNSIPFPLFAPTIEKGSGAFLPDHPYKLIEQGLIHDVPWITSNTKDEGIFPTCLFVFLHIVESIDDQWEELAPYLLHLTSYNTANKSEMDSIISKVREHYFHDQVLSYNNTDPIVKMFSDRHFLVDAEKTLKLHSKVSTTKVYYYLFEYIMEQPFFLYDGMKKGAAHGDDSRFYLKVFGTPSKLPESDQKMMELFIEFLTEYAKTGNVSFKNITWEPVEPESESIKFMDIVNPDHVKMKDLKHIGDYEFWESLPLKEYNKLV